MVWKKDLGPILNFRSGENWQKTQCEATMHAAMASSPTAPSMAR